MRGPIIQALTLLIAYQAYIIGFGIEVVMRHAWIPVSNAPTASIYNITKTTRIVSISSVIALFL